MEMSRGVDLNASDDNNYSIISKDELQEFNDYNASTQHRQQGFNNSNNLPDSEFSNSFAAGSEGPHNGINLYKYIDDLFKHLHHDNPEAFRYLLQRAQGVEYDVCDDGRRTPFLFSGMHSLAKLDFPGLFYQLEPNTLNGEGAIVHITNDIYPRHFDLRNDEYPGPLSLASTLDEQITTYLHYQLSMEVQDQSPIDWDSAHLLINFLELLIKDNGKRDMNRIIKLINQGVEMHTSDLRKVSKTFDTISQCSFSRASSRATSRASSRPPSPTEFRENHDPDLPTMEVSQRRGPSSVLSSSLIRKVDSISSEQKQCQNLDIFRGYIFSGRFEEAIKFAIRSELWDHAFALALRINNRELLNECLITFCRRAIFKNDPLLTMHELLASKTPKIIASNQAFSNSDSSDWRSHLSIILAVKKYQPDHCCSSIEALGDKLLTCGSYYAAHLCYLLAETSFGLDRNSQRYRRKFDLIGWQSSTINIPSQRSTYENCHKQFSGLNYWSSAPEQCIKFTEIYEYTLKLKGSDCLSLSIHLLPYKYIMIYKMLSKQKTKNAYEYCEDIGGILGSARIDWTMCDSLHFYLVKNIRDISFRLHYSLLNMEKEREFHGSQPQWLSNIEEVYCQFCRKFGFCDPTTIRVDLIMQGLLKDENSQMPEFDQTQNYQINQNSDHVGQIQNIREPLTESVRPSEMPSHEAHAQSQMQSVQRHDLTSRMPQMPYQPISNERHTAANITVHPSSSQSASVHKETSKNFQQTVGELNSHVLSRENTYPVKVDNFKETNGISFSQQNFIPLSTDSSLITSIQPPSDIPKNVLMTQPPKNVSNKKANFEYPEEVSKNNQVLSGRLDNSNYGDTNFMPNSGLIGSNSVNFTNDGFGQQMQNKLNTFRPVLSNEEEEDFDYDKAFRIVQSSRSRTQSMASAGSDQQPKLSNRSRNESDSKEPVVAHNVPPSLQSMKEEPKVEDIKSKPNEKSNPGIWSRIFHKKQTEVHLPDDKDKAILFDSSTNTWINRDKSDNSPLAPPPMMNVPEMSEREFHGTIKSRYANPLATVVKQSSGTLPATLSNIDRNQQDWMRYRSPELSNDANVNRDLSSYQMYHQSPDSNFLQSQRSL